MIEDRTRRLVIAARKVAFGGIGLPDDPNIWELDAASEAFAADVPWDDEPVTTTKIEKE